MLHFWHPATIEHATWNYAVLGLAIVFEGISFLVATKAFIVEKGERSVWRAIRASKDPTTFALVFEDGAALSGLLVAFAGIFLAQRLGNPYFDAAASIVIGMILAGVAIVLAYESKGLLVGEGVDPQMLEEIRRLVESEPDVLAVNRPLTMHFGPNTILLAMDIRFRGDLHAEELEKTIDRIEKKIRERYPQIRHIFLEADSLRPGRRELADNAA